MIKKFITFAFILLFYFLFSFSDIHAKEYCHIHQNDKLIETLELPFYFYNNSVIVNFNTSLPTITYESTYTIIDSPTKCDSIKENVTEIKESNKTTHTVYDYSSILHNNYNLEELYQNSKLTEENSTIKGYSSLLDEEAPIFQGYKETYKVNIDNPLSLSFILSNISVYDNRDGNLTDKIKITYNEYEENITKLGTYPIILSVTDNSSNKASITFYIQIIDTSPPTIQGKQNYVSYLSSPLTIEQIKNEISATDNVDKNLTPQIYVCDDTYSANKDKIGLYQLYFCAYDSSSNGSSPYKVIVEVKDDIPPIIEGLNTYTSYLSHPLSIQEIMYSLAASDNHEDISSSIFITSDYYSNTFNTLGEKKIIFQAMDKYNNISLPFTVTIHLKDDIPPQIFGLDTYSSKLSNPLSLTYLKQQLTVLDNFDGNISSSLEILEDTYSSNINKLGTYYISFQARDYSNNISENFKISITTIDDVPPSIKGPSSLKYSIDNKPSLSNILSEFKIIDNIDENIELIVENDTFSSSFSTGTYYLTLSGTDSSNNKSTPFTSKIEIVDILLNLNAISLSLPTSKKYTIDEINKIINLNEPYTITQDTYSPNYTIEGTYTIEYQLEDSSKIILTINTYTLTLEKESTTQKKETFFSKLKSFFKKLFVKIKEFFTNIFSLYICLKY